jgi:hypothetical protein
LPEQRINLVLAGTQRGFRDFRELPPIHGA